MKKIFVLSAFVLLPLLSINAQQTIVNEKHERVLNHASENIYDVTFKNKEGIVVQKGQYWKEGEKFKPHGTWLLFDTGSDKIITKAKFDQGKQIWIETNLNGKTIQTDEKQLAIKQLQHQISALEKRITELKQK